MPMTNDPAARKRSLATRKNAPPAPPGNTRAVVTGARADGGNLPGFESTLAEVHSVVPEFTEPADMLLVEVLAREFHSYRHASDVLDRMSDAAYSRRLNAAKLVTRKARVLGELADRLGMTPLARAKLGLTVARTEQVQVKPVRTVERSQALARLLADVGAVSRPEAIVDVDVVNNETEDSDE